ncbi:MAG: glycosyltransferase family 2 protein, partial [Bacteroidales bacterium]|nr:glycosyltransferase family 2 protein [Bacteroidales bacterium]
MRTAIVILNWNGRKLLEQFLPPLLESVDGVRDVVMVADNGSSDDSLPMMAERFPRVPVISMDRNYGFAEGYDKALEGLDADYYLLLNSDIEVADGWLEPLTEWMEYHPECGICAPKLHSYTDRDSFEYAGAAGGYIDRYGYPFCRGRVMKRLEKDEGQYDIPEEVMWVTGACLMIRSGLWKSLGGLDPSFFAHMEEIDMCWRARLAGWHVNVV